MKHDDPIVSLTKAKQKSLCKSNLKFFLSQDVMVTREGYPFETYDVVTEDQYILTIHRIPHGKQAPVLNKEYRRNQSPNKIKSDFNSDFQDRE